MLSTAAAVQQVHVSSVDRNAANTMATALATTATTSTAVVQSTPTAKSFRRPIPFGAVVPRARQLVAERHRVIQRIKSEETTGVGGAAQFGNFGKMGNFQKNFSTVSPKTGVVTLTSRAPPPPPSSSSVEFDFDAARQALLNARLQKQQQQMPLEQQQRNNKGWEPTLRMLRQRHRAAHLELQPQQQQQRQLHQHHSSDGVRQQRRPPIFNGPLLALPEQQQQQQQSKQLFGLRTEARDGLDGNRLEELPSPVDDVAAQQHEKQQQEQLLAARSALGEPSSTRSGHNKPVVHVGHIVL